MREKYLDLGTLNMLRDLQRDLQRDLIQESGSDEGGDILQQVLGMYLEVAPGEVDRMAKVLERGDYEALADEAHQLKSNSSMVGAVLVADFARMIEEYLCQTVEALGGERDPQYLAHLVRRTKDHLEKTCHFLRREERMLALESDSVSYAVRFQTEERGIV